MKYNTIQPTEELGTPHRARPALLAVLVVVLGGAFLINELDWSISARENYAIAPDDAESQVEAGSSSRQLAYGLIGLLGLTLVVVPSRQRLPWCTLPALLIGGYYLTCLASVAWSDNPQLTLKRVGILTFCLVSVFGVVRHLSPRDLLRVAVAIAALLVAIGFCAELSLGTFRPLAGEYRFAGTVHPNTQGSYCGVMLIAAFFGIRGSRRRKWLYAVLFCVAAVFLVLTKSRSCLGGTLIALSLAWLLGRSRTTKTFVVLGTSLAAGSFLVAALLLGVEVTSELDSAARLGRAGLESGFGSLNGRMPLWTYLMGFVAERPLLGYGYQSFWSASRIYEVSIEQQWTVPSAHSVYVDVLLSLGLVGGTLFAVSVVWGICRGVRRCSAGGDAADGYLLSLLVFAVVSAVFESGFAQPASFDSFLAACSLVWLLLQPARLPWPAPAVASPALAAAGIGGTRSCGSR